jgi:hypothetical protein
LSGSEWIGSGRSGFPPEPLALSLSKGGLKRTEFYETGLRQAQPQRGGGGGGKSVRIGSMLAPRGRRGNFSAVPVPSAIARSALRTIVPSRCRRASDRGAARAGAPSLAATGTRI